MYAVAAGQGRGTLDPLPAERCPAVAGDRDQLHQLVVNLIDNAIKYGGEGKTVTVEARRSPRRPLDAGAVSGPSLRSRRRWATRAPGIAREHIPRLTERFYRVDTGALAPPAAAPGSGSRSSSTSCGATRATCDRERARQGQPLHASCCRRRRRRDRHGTVT